MCAGQLGFECVLHRSSSEECLTTPSSTIPLSDPELSGQGRRVRRKSTPLLPFFLNLLGVSSVLEARLAAGVHCVKGEEVFLGPRSLQHRGKDRCVNNLIQNDFSRSLLCTEPLGPCGGVTSSVQ